MSCIISLRLFFFTTSTSILWKIRNAEHHHVGRSRSSLEGARNSTGFGWFGWLPFCLFLPSSLSFRPLTPPTLAPTRTQLGLRIPHFFFHLTARALLAGTTSSRSNRLIYIGYVSLSPDRLPHPMGCCRRDRRGFYSRDAVNLTINPIPRLSSVQWDYFLLLD